MTLYRERSAERGSHRPGTSLSHHFGHHQQLQTAAARASQFLEKR